jgi:hypothetical protein
MNKRLPPYMQHFCCVIWEFRTELTENTEFFDAMQIRKPEKGADVAVPMSLRRIFPKKICVNLR